MKSKTSFFNKGLFVNSLKRFSWIGTIYFIALFLAVPMKILMYYDNSYTGPINNIFRFGFQTQVLLILTVPVLAAMVLFKYIHSKKLGDLIHSLPIKREKIYENYILTGIMLLIMPLIINGIICIILNLSLNLYELYTVKDVFIWFGITSIMNIVIFLVSVFVAMNTGVLIAQGILTYIVLFLPLGLFGLLAYNMELLLYGFYLELYFQNNTRMLSPITRVFDLASRNYPMTFTEVCVYISICIVLYFLSKYLYRIRKVEAYSSTIVFPVLRPVVKYGITFGIMLVGGVYFGMTQQSIKWTLFGYFIASLIGYFVAQIILKKSLHVFKNIKGYIVYSFVIILILIGFKTDIIGYEKYAPESEDIKSVYFSENVYFEDENMKRKFFINKENIKNIELLHNEIIKDKKNNMNIKKDIKHMTFIYELKNGKKVVRNYEIPYKNYYSYLKPIYESDEYKKTYYEILGTNYIDIDKIEIISQVYENQIITLVDKNDIKDAVENLKEDINNATYNEMVDNKEPWAIVSVRLSNRKTFYFTWQQSYVNSENWLEEKGYIDNFNVMPK